MQYEPSIESKGDRREHEHREQILRGGVQGVQRVPENPVVRESLPDPLQEDLDRARGEHDEAPEYRRVHDAGDRLAQNLALRDADREHVLEAPPRMVGTILDDAEAKVLRQALNVDGEDSRGDGEDEQEDDVLR